MIYLSDVKKVLNYGPTASSDDALIEDMINVGIAYIAAQSNLSMATSGGDFQEWFDYPGDDLVYLSLRASDIVINSITGYDIDGNASTIPAANYFKQGSRTWQIVPDEHDIVKLKVIYSSVYGQRAMDNLVKQIAVWEYLKGPNKTGSFNHISQGVNEININFKTEKDFYSDIENRLIRIAVLW